MKSAVSGPADGVLILLTRGAVSLRAALPAGIAADVVVWGCFGGDYVGPSVGFVSGIDGSSLLELGIGPVLLISLDSTLRLCLYGVDFGVGAADAVRSAWRIIEYIVSPWQAAVVVAWRDIQLQWRYRDA